MFGERTAGESKASVREGLRYANLLLNLRVGEERIRFAKFALVGISGLVVNSLLLAFDVKVLGLFYLLAAILATQGSTFWNFLLTEWLVFSQQGSSTGARRRAGLFFAMNNAAFVLRGPMMFALTTFLGVHYLASNLISMIALLMLRFTIADRWIWRASMPFASPSKPLATPAPHPAPVSAPAATEGV